MLSFGRVESLMIYENIFQVDGVPGFGFAEFHYNNKSGRPEEYSSKDPQWYQNVLVREAEYKKLEYMSMPEAQKK